MSIICNSKLQFFEPPVKMARKTLCSAHGTICANYTLSKLWAKCDFATRNGVARQRTLCKARHVMFALFIRAASKLIKKFLVLFSKRTSFLIKLTF